jgi:hypothetical protein
VIAEVQITGGTGKANNDVVRLYNPTDAEVVIAGWRLRKRTQPGGEDSIRLLPQGSAISAKGYFTWANSEDGFAESIGAHTSSTQTIAANNSIALLDADGGTIDALAWGEGHVNPFGEGSPYPQNPGANQVLKRKFFGDTPQDTQNNAEDFVL